MSSLSQNRPRIGPGTKVLYILKQNKKSHISFTVEVEHFQLAALVGPERETGHMGDTG